MLLFEIRGTLLLLTLFNMVALVCHILLLPTCLVIAFGFQYKLPLHWNGFQLSHFATTPRNIVRLSSNLLIDSVKDQKINYKSSLRKEIAKHTTGGWFPIGAPSTLNEVLPFDIEIAGQQLVVWKNPVDNNNPTNGWNVMTDLCPHRLAPLSKGRIDTETGCIECPYHGWQFANDGKCTSIPQLELEAQSKLQLPSTAAHSLPVYMTEDLLWAFISLPTESDPSVPNYFPNLPDDDFPELNLPSFMTVMRDVPYSFDFLVENFMDVAHLPFAHHKLQGLRSDARPIPIQVLTTISNTSTKNLFEIQFNDVVRGKPREAIASFRPPCTYHFRVKNPLTGLYKIGLILYCVPIGPGRARAIVTAKLSSSKKENVATTSTTAASATKSTATTNEPAVSAKSQPSTLFQRVFTLFQWFLHLSTNKFLDSDIWVHEQEFAARSKSILDSTSMSNSGGITNNNDNNNIIIANRIRKLTSVESTDDVTANALGLKYVLVSQQSDNGVKEWRNWWKATGLSKSSIFGPATNLIRIPISKQIDRYQGHIRYCKICQNALKNIQFIKKWSLLVALLPIVLTTSMISRIVGVVGYIILNYITYNLEAEMNGGVYLQGTKVSAAQLAPFGMS